MARLTPNFNLNLNAKLILVGRRPLHDSKLNDGLTLTDFIEFNKMGINLKREPNQKRMKLPPWLKVNIPKGENFQKITEQLKDSKLATVCQEARCPNINECWNTSSDEKYKSATATIMIMGDTCTRGCRFCSIKTARRPAPLNPDEPRLTAEAISTWSVDYIVITSVDRDDVEDLGAGHIAETIHEIKLKRPNMMVEALVPDFQGKKHLIDVMLNKYPDELNVFAHNIETVREYTPLVRDPRAKYDQSMNVLKMAKELTHGKIVTKSSIMVGFGESFDQVVQTMKDLRTMADVDCLTIGQYMQPTTNHIKVDEYVLPSAFAKWEEIGKQLGFLYVASGPLVRSSYRAGEFYLQSIVKNRL